MSRRADSFTRLLVALTAAIPLVKPPPAAALPAWRIVVAGQAGGTALARLAPPRVSMPELGEGEVTIEAREFGTNEAGQMVATGGVTVTQGAVRLTADKVTADRDTGEVVAEGNVVFTEPGRTVRGQRIIYNTDTRQVHAAAAETVVNGVVVRAQQLEANPARYAVSGATVTTCDLPRPHYQLTARSVTVIPNDRIIARHVGVWLLGVRLFVVPSLTARIGAGRGEGGGSLFPRLGRNSRDSFFVEKLLPLVQAPRLYLDLDTRLSLRRGLTGGFDAAAPAGSGLQWIGALKYRAEAPNQRTQFLEVDRVPEVGLLGVWPAPTPRTRRRPAGRSAPAEAPPNTPAAPAPLDFRPSREVGADAEHQPGLLRPPEPGRWYLRAESTIGYFHQRSGSVLGGTAESRSRARLDLRATAARSGLRVAGLSLPTLQLFFRQSFYNDGNRYTVFGFGARQDWSLGAHWSSGLRVFAHRTGQDTPFRFDRVEVRNELQPALTYRSGALTLAWLGRMDVDRRQLFDQEYSIARVFHCLEPRLSYRARRRQFNVELRIVALAFE